MFIIKDSYILKSLLKITNCHYTERTTRMSLISVVYDGWPIEDRNLQQRLYERKTQVVIYISPHLYVSSSSHCKDIKAMNNFLPSTLEHLFWNTLSSLYDAVSKITKVSDWGDIYVSLTYLQRKKSGGIKSGDLGGHAIGLPLPIQRPGKMLFKVLRTSFNQCGGRHLVGNWC